MRGHEVHQLKAVSPDRHQAPKQHISADAPDRHRLDKAIDLGFYLPNVLTNH
jgi:hypothetical protein